MFLYDFGLMLLAQLLSSSISCPHQLLMACLLLSFCTVNLPFIPIFIDPFGCLVFPYLHDYAPHKLSPRSRPCVFLGYSMSHHGFRCLDCSTNHVFISRHAIFDELNYPFQGTSCSRSRLTPLLVHSLSLLPFQWLTHQHNPILYHVHVDLA
jgi:hypothetical protein